MSTRLNNVPVTKFTECRIASNSGPIPIKSKKDVPFPEYPQEKNCSFQGGGKMQHVLEAHKKVQKL